MSESPAGRKAIGWRAFVRSGLFVLFAAAFVALAVSTVALDGPWTVGVAYLICAGVMVLLARKVFPHRVPLRDESQEASRVARRSGNPAIRASGNDDERRTPPRKG